MRHLSSLPFLSDISSFMKFAGGPLQEAVFLKRYKRFFAEIEYKGKILVAHVPNTGSMKTCIANRVPCRFSTSDNPKRKLKYTLEMIKPQSVWIGVNTQIPNAIVREAYLKGQIAHWKKFKCYKSEVKINDHTRFDLALWKNSKKFKSQEKIPCEVFSKKSKEKFHFIEIKNVSLKENGVAFFPDAVSLRAKKHLDELMKMLDCGHSAEIVFTIQRRDIKILSPADHIDPEYGKKLREAQKKGVKITPLLCSLTKTEISIDVKNPVKFIFSNACL